MGFVVVHNVLGVRKRPCPACGITLSTLAPDLRVPFGSKKPYPLWALPDRFPSTAKSDVRDVVAGIKRVLRNALGQHPPQAPGSMNRRENTSNSSYGSLGCYVSNMVSRQVDWEMPECLQRTSVLSWTRCQPNAVCRSGTNVQPNGRIASRLCRMHPLLIVV
ncbi:hypothetical protein EDD85DRAFT_107659 [Armillaria nabsnona]|nr:hypothetical protein EDD85DRAFT_107659 [Armillaria nabsnona]